MCSLSMFPDPPPRGFISTFETNGNLSSSPVTSLEFVRYNSSVEIPSYKCVSASNINDSKLLLNKSPFAPRLEFDLWRKSFTAWTKHGVIAALVELCENNKTADVTWVNYFARKLTNSIRWTKSLRNAFYPHLMLTEEDMLNEFASVSNWKSGLVRACAWHPHIEKLAVAFYDDQVKIFSSKSSFSPQLKTALQKGISDLCWRPYATSILAVASCSGIAIWNLDPTSLVTTPSPASCVQMLMKPHHSPVSSIQWSPCGKHLLSCSPRDSSMMLWNVDTGVGIVIHQSTGGGVPFARWSPDGLRVFSSSCSKVFRVWECGTWTSDWWSSGLKRVIAACWDPEGTTLLIAVKDELVIYSVCFTNVDSSESSDAVGGAKNAIPIINISQIYTEANDEQLCVGGCVQAMVWDNTGTRLAISFSSKESPQELIAVYRTKIGPSLIVTPCGFVRGYQDEIPQCMAFKEIIQDGVTLTVCWSSGRLTNVRFWTSETDSSPSKAKQLNSPIDQLFSVNSPIPH